MVSNGLPKAAGRARATACCARYWCSAALAAAIASAISPAGAAEYALDPGQKAVGENVRYTVKDGEILPDIARQFDLGYTELVAVNPDINPWVPGAGRVITIPARHILPEGPRQGIVINLAQSRLFYFPPGGDRVEAYPITIGFIGKNTPLGTSRVVSKEASPTWYPPASIRAEEPELPAAVPPGPDNPLGAYAMHLGWKNYLIHGTNKPDSIGRTVSHGCIRLYPEDIERLFGEVGVGTPVRTVEQPATAGWKGDALYVQVYPSKAQADEIDTMHAVTPDPASGVDAIVRAAAGDYAQLVDWSAVHRSAQHRNAMAVKVADRSGGGIASSREDEVVAAPSTDASPYRSSGDASYAAPSYGSSRDSGYSPPDYRSAATYRWSSSPSSSDSAAASGWGGIPRSASGDIGYGYAYGQPVLPPPDAQRLYSTWGPGR